MLVAGCCCDISCPSDECLDFGADSIAVVNASDVSCFGTVGQQGIGFVDIELSGVTGDDYAWVLERVLHVCHIGRILGARCCCRFQECYAVLDTDGLPIRVFVVTFDHCLMNPDNVAGVLSVRETTGDTHDETVYWYICNTGWVKQTGLLSFTVESVLWQAMPPGEDCRTPSCEEFAEEDEGCFCAVRWIPDAEAPGGYRWCILSWSCDAGPPDCIDCAEPAAGGLYPGEVVTTQCGPLASTMIECDPIV